MVNTLVLFDVPRQSARRRLESLLRGDGFVWLCPCARWAAGSMAERQPLIRHIRSRLKGEPYVIVFVELPARSRTGARWLTATAAVHR